VALSTVVVPNVKGMTLTQALAALRAKHLIPYYKHVTTSAYPAETVYQQSVASGATVDRGTRVDLTVARAPSVSSPKRGHGKKKHD